MAANACGAQPQPAYIQTVELLATHRLRHPLLVEWSELLPIGAMTCVVCLQPIPGKRAALDAHMQLMHYGPLVNYVARTGDDDDPVKSLMVSQSLAPKETVDYERLTTQPSDLRTDPTRFLLKDFILLPKSPYHFRLSLCKGDTPATAGYFVRMTNRTKEAICLGPVQVFNSRTTTVLKSDTLVLLKPGDKFKLMIPNGVISNARWNTFLVAFSSESDETLTWEYHKLINVCCGYNSGTKSALVKRYFPNQTLSGIMKPVRNYAILGKLLHEYKVPSFRLTTDNYMRTLRLCSNMEQIEQQMVLDAYEHVHIFHTNQFISPTEVVLAIPFVKRQIPDLSTYDQVLLDCLCGCPLQCETHILAIQPHGVVIKYNAKIIAFNQYRVRFRLGDITFALENSTGEWVHGSGRELLQYVFPSPQLALQPTQTSPAVEPAALQWQNGDILSNAEQMQAVQQIVQRSTNASPTAAPYLLFGPPGTGKTQTLIEAVYQVLRAKTDARILLCTSSNTAADELMVRLARIFPHNQCPFDHVVYRVLKRQLAETDPAHWRSSGAGMMDALLAGSNYCQRAAPTAEVLRRYRVIVCTLTMSGLLPGDVETGGQFTDVFVDECGSATESATLVAMRRGCTGARMTANVVLAGDPKQLGPVLKSTDAIDIGYGKSMLERLMSDPAYARDAQTNRYPAQLVTKLVRNYRSHAAIIAPSNRLFYDNELQAVGPADRTHRFVNWTPLPNPAQPVIFHAMCNRLATQGDDRYSWSNRAEMDCIAGYIEQLLASGRASQRDIVVITPYRRQLQQMVQAFAGRWPDVAVSTVEQFQGKERPVVLVSTVRSRQAIGFLRNEKRLNVLLTRAQALQIVVGDPLVLMRSRHWRDVLREWQRAGVCVGDSFAVGGGGVVVAPTPATKQADVVKTEMVGRVDQVKEIEETVVEEDMEKVKVVEKEVGEKTVKVEADIGVTKVEKVEDETVKVEADIGVTKVEKVVDETVKVEADIEVTKVEKVVDETVKVEADIEVTKVEKVEEEKIELEEVNVENEMEEEEWGNEVIDNFMEIFVRTHCLIQ